MYLNTEPQRIMPNSFMVSVEVEAEAVLSKPFRDSGTYLAEVKETFDSNYLWKTVFCSNLLPSHLSACTLKNVQLTLKGKYLPNIPENQYFI